MPNYFGPIKRGNGEEGCSASHSSPDGSSPQDISQPKCKIYSKESDEYRHIDSCLNQKDLDAMTAAGEKSVVRTPNGPALLTATGISTNGTGILTTCYDYNRYVKFLRATSPADADKLKKDPCSFSKSLNMCGITCKNINEADLPKTITPTQGNVIGKITASHNFSLSFDFTPRGIFNTWASLLHFTTGNDCCDLGERAPGIWFAPNTFQVFAIHIGHSNEGGWACRPESDAIQPNTKISFKLVCSGQNITVTIGNSNFTYTHDENRYAGPLTVYSGSPWYPAANVLIENLSYVTL